MNENMVNALFDIQQNLKVTKTEQAKNFKYRTCEGILTALKPLLAPHKGIVWFSDQIISVDGWKYLEAAAHLQVGGDELVCKALAREAEKQPGMNPAQVTGSASSYARKYALCAMFGIDDGSDPDFYEQSNNQQNRTEGNGNQHNQNRQQFGNNQRASCNNFFSEEETQTMRNVYKTHRDIYEQLCVNYRVKKPTEIETEKKARLFYEELIKKCIAADSDGGQG